MKYLLITLSIVSLLSMCSIAQENRASKLWIKFSAVTQNINYRLSLIGADTSPDYSEYKDALDNIDKILNELVTMKEVRSHKVEFHTKDLRFLKKTSEFYAEKYGVYVAREMLDLGVKMQFVILKEKDPIKLHIRMPQKDMEQFIELLNIYKKDQEK